MFKKRVSNCQQGNCNLFVNAIAKFETYNFCVVCLRYESNYLKHTQDETKDLPDVIYDIAMRIRIGTDNPTTLRHLI